MSCPSGLGVQRFGGSAFTGFSLGFGLGIQGVRFMVPPPFVVALSRACGPWSVSGSRVSTGLES